MQFDVSLLKKFRIFLSKEDLNRFRVVVGFGLGTAILDVVGVASILPFMSLAMNPDVIESVPLFLYIFEELKFTSKSQFVLTAGILTLAILLGSLLVKGIYTYQQARFVLLCEYGVCKRLFEGYLRQPYEWFLNRNSSELNKNVLSEVGTAIGGVLTPVLNLAFSSMAALLLVCMLLVIEPVATFLSGLLFGIAYAIIFLFAGSTLKRIGEERLNSNALRFGVLAEAFTAIKSIKLQRLEPLFLQRFQVPGLVYASHQTTANAIKSLPKYVFEALTFSGILLVTLFYLTKGGKMDDLLPRLSLFAFAGYRLLPAFQQIYASLTQLKFTGPSLTHLHGEFAGLRDRCCGKEISRIEIRENLVLKDVWYLYPEATVPSLRGINLKIPVGKKIGLVGKTGSGKTTLVDILLGLIKPARGQIEIDGNSVLSSEMDHWGGAIGYVPQEVILVDDTIAANIAFGVAESEIDFESLERAAKQAQIYDFIIEKMPLGFRSLIGERGVRLSGGQRQRLGIARALYRAPKILIMDEATSALDNATERKVMATLDRLANDITIILVAHRLTTIRSCDTVYLLEDGEVRDSGGYCDLVSSSEVFREMVEVAG